MKRRPFGRVTGVTELPQTKKPRPLGRGFFMPVIRNVTLLVSL